MRGQLIRAETERDAAISERDRLWQVHSVMLGRLLPAADGRDDDHHGAAVAPMVGAVAAMMQGLYSDYVVFADESGDHGLVSVDHNYPIFVLALSVFSKRDYIHTVIPAVHALKFDYFGHDNVVLHEHDIRRDTGAFASLKTPAKKTAFMDRLTQLIQDTPFTVVAVVIRKDQLNSKYVIPDSPYDLAVKFGLERLYHYLCAQRQGQATTHVVFEKRGKKEDAELELEFRRVCAGGNYRGATLPFEMVPVDKLSNSAGLQISDLIARPIGLSVLRPQQKNQAFEVIKTKLYTNAGGRCNGWGLKFPP